MKLKVERLALVHMSITIIEVVKMFLTGLSTKVKGYTTREAIMKYAPDGTVIAEMTLGVGGGSKKYPVMWVNVPVWAKLAEEVIEVIDRKGIAVEANGMLLVRLYNGEHGTNVAIELKNVRELRVYDRDGELVRVLSGEKEKVE